MEDFIFWTLVAAGAMTVVCMIFDNRRDDDEDF